MPANPKPLFESTDSRHYYYRRSLSSRELVAAAAVGVGVGVAAFYVARLLAQRTPLLPREVVADPRKRQPRRAPG